MTKATTQTVELSALSLIHRCGPQTKDDLFSLVTGMAKGVLTNLKEFGYIKPDPDDKDVFHITQSGKRRIGVEVSRAFSGSRTREALGEDDHYTCPELRPNTDRAGSNDAFALPSRRADGLLYPDGRFIPVAP